MMAGGIMKPHITLPQQQPRSTATTAGHGVPSLSAGTNTSHSHSRQTLRIPRFFRRLFKFPQMDFELAIWEMSSLLFTPNKVFRTMYYHRQTRNTWHRPDPSFTYLLSFFSLLSSMAWALAYADGFSKTLRIMFVFIFAHFLGLSLLLSTAAYFLIGRFLGPDASALPGFPRRTNRRRGQGLFPHQTGQQDSLEFGYCFDVTIRAFFPVWVFVYVVQFFLMPVIAKDFWASRFIGNLLYLLAFAYYHVITFLGYNALPFLQHTRLLLTPIPIFVIIWLPSLFGFNMAKHLAPVLWTGASLRSRV